MTDSYSFCEGSSFESSLRDEEFDEEDVWAVLKERTDTSPKVKRSKLYSTSASRYLPSTPKSVPRADNSSRFVQQSAPVKISELSKLYRSNGSDSEIFKNGSFGGVGFESDVENDDKDKVYDGVCDDDSKLPPHEWVARKLAKTQISSFSVCEGVGRTLKGRDLSKVRDAVLTRTGFIE